MKSWYLFFFIYTKEIEMIEIYLKLYIFNLFDIFKYSRLYLVLKHVQPIVHVWCQITTNSFERKTRSGTWLPQSHVGGQGLYLRSLDHLGRSSEAIDWKKKTKKVVWRTDRRTDGRTDGPTHPLIELWLTTKKVFICLNAFLLRVYQNL